MEIGNDTTIAKEKSTTDRSWAIIISYSISSFSFEALPGLLTTQLFFFYETVVLLPTFLVTLAFVIFGIWDAVNDPIMGFLSDRPNRLWNRWGRRFPWIIFSSVPVCVFFFLVFTPPELDPVSGAIPLFFWLVTFLLLYELFLTTITLNRTALLPEKFRTNRDRNRVSAMTNLFLTVGMLIGMVIPPLIVSITTSYSLAALFVVIFSLVFVFLSIPGCRDDPRMIEQAIKARDEGVVKDPFITIIKDIIKNRNFWAYIIVIIAMDTLYLCSFMSIPFFNDYILMQPKDNEMTILLGFLLLSFGAVPIVFFALKKISHYKMIFIGVIWAAVSMIPVLFVNTTLGITLVGASVAVGVVAFSIAGTIAFTDIIDETVAAKGKRQEGSYMGVWVLFKRLATVIASIFIGATHILTGFDPTLPFQTGLAQWGIRMHFALLPLIFLIIAGLIFYKFYDLTPDKVKVIKTKLKELNL